MMMMMEEHDDSEISVIRQKSEVQPRRQAKKIKIPRRAPSVEIPPPRVMVMTAGIKPKPIKLNRCLISPLTLYELCADVVDKMDFPDPFDWNEEQVADWIEQVVGLSQYRECFIVNHINGRRLLRLEDPSVLPEINIHNFVHIKMISGAIRKLYATDFIRFVRSIGLPIRKPLTHCTWFKSRTGPNWGIRQNWTRSDILRWMKILMPKPIYLDHWDLVWYQRPDFPKVLCARIPEHRAELLPRYQPPEEYCNEFTTPRKFRLQSNIPEESQLIWMEHRPGSPLRKEPKKEGVKREVKRKAKVEKESRLYPKKMSLSGLAGKDLILARRQMPKPKFLKTFETLPPPQEPIIVYAE